MTDEKQSIWLITQIENPEEKLPSRSKMNQPVGISVDPEFVKRLSGIYRAEEISWVTSLPWK